MEVKVKYIGPIRDVIKVEEETISLSEARMEALVNALIKRHGPRFQDVILEGEKQEIRKGLCLLSGGKRLGLQSPLEEGSEVVILPAIAGGKERGMGLLTMGWLKAQGARGWLMKIYEVYSPYHKELVVTLALEEKLVKYLYSLGKDYGALWVKSRQGGEGTTTFWEALEQLTFFGCGSLSLQEVNEEEGRAVVLCKESLEAKGVHASLGLQKRPQCHFLRGLLVSLMAQVCNLSPDLLIVQEKFCLAKGDEECLFIIERSEGSHGE